MDQTKTEELREAEATEVINVDASRMEFTHVMEALLKQAHNNKNVLEYKDIPNFPISTVPGHKGELIFLYL